MGGFILGDKQADGLSKKAQWEQEKKTPNGIKPVEKCDDRGKNCKTTMPSILIQESAAKAFNAPMDSLLNADEFDEIIGSLFGNLANEAFSGTNGLLGLSDKTHGASGNESYFDAIKNDPTNHSNSDEVGNNPITKALAIEARVVKAQFAIVTEIENINKCKTTKVTLPTFLDDTVATYTAEIVKNTQTLAKLSDMSAQYASSTTDTQVAQLLTQLENMRTNDELNGILVAINEEDNLASIRTYIADFKKATNYVAESCTATTTPSSIP